MPHHPYLNRPPYTRWSRAVGQTAPDAVDAAVGFPFRLSQRDKIATAGSCFAQHISRHCRSGGLTYYCVEYGHPLADADLQAEFNYGIYSARYGNIYTSRQLLQLFDRAFGRFAPRDTEWRADDGSFIDPLRPTIQPGNFATLAELNADRSQHLGKVRQLFETLDCFIFTLGLTECWYDDADGTVFPVCPGVAGGIFNPGRHRFANLTVADVVADLTAFVDRLRKVNPGARVILTVSPVPLAATAVDRHVLVSTVASKAVLRVACDEICRQHPNVAYFPSYEIVTGPHAGGRYYAQDLRSVTEAGVEHAMRQFFAHATEAPGRQEVLEPPSVPAPPDMAAVVKAICDENLLDPPEVIKKSEQKRARRLLSLLRHGRA